MPLPSLSCCSFIPLPYYFCSKKNRKIVREKQIFFSLGGKYTPLEKTWPNFCCSFPSLFPQNGEPAIFPVILHFDPFPFSCIITTLSRDAVVYKNVISMKEEYSSSDFSFFSLLFFFKAKTVILVPTKLFLGCIVVPRADPGFRALSSCDSLLLAGPQRASEQCTCPLAQRWCCSPTTRQPWLERSRGTCRLP